MLRPNSPLENTPHNTSNGVISITCGNRSCPKCQAAARAQWLAEREAELLPVEYFHLVFTLPQPIARLALQNARIIYSILFQAVSETLLTIAADPKHLGAAIGFLAVLHTWGQNSTSIRISIASCRVAESAPTTRAGSLAANIASRSSFPSKFSATSSATDS